MPSGKTHDWITLLLLAPTFAAVWVKTSSFALASLATLATAFGGLMFGPDLDTQSVQYRRWGVFRFLWWPYKVVIKHRSRWSHGIIFGTIIRVLYFSGVIALLALGGIYLRAWFIQGGLPEPHTIIEAALTTYARLTEHIGRHTALALFAGLWWGAALHTLADVGWSMLRKSSDIF